MKAKIPISFIEFGIAERTIIRHTVRPGNLSLQLKRVEIRAALLQELLPQQANSITDDAMALDRLDLNNNAQLTHPVQQEPVS